MQINKTLASFGQMCYFTNKNMRSKFSNFDVPVLHYAIVEPKLWLVCSSCYL